MDAGSHLRVSVPQGDGGGPVMAALGALPRRWDAGDPAGDPDRVSLHSVPTGGNAVLRVLPPPLPADMRAAAGWPLQDYLEFGGLPGAVPCGRLHTRQLLWEWRLTGLSENAELAVSELLTNAVDVSYPSEDILPVRLWLLSDGARLLILVWDGSPQPPLPVYTSDEMENGRGLMLVEAVCTRWDWYQTPDLAGKTVWALCEK